MLCLFYGQCEIRKSVTLFQSSHTHAGEHAHEYCEACGQKLPRHDGYGYGGPRKHNRIGIGISIALHLLIVAYYLFHPKDKITIKPPAKEGEMVWEWSRNAYSFQERRRIRPVCQTPARL